MRQIADKILKTTHGQFRIWIGGLCILVALLFMWNIVDSIIVTRRLKKQAVRTYASGNSKSDMCLDAYKESTSSAELAALIGQYANSNGLKVEHLPESEVLVLSENMSLHNFRLSARGNYKEMITFLHEIESQEPRVFTNVHYKLGHDRIGIYGTFQLRTPVTEESL